MTEKVTARYQITFFGAFIILFTISFPFWGMEKPKGVLNKPIEGNNDLLYFGTDAPDNFIIYSPGRKKNVLIMPASERMADMIVSPDGKVVWTSTKAGYIDRYEIPLGTQRFTSSVRRQKVAPVLSTVALSADERFVAVGYANSEDYNSRNVKILPSDTMLVRDELADFSVSGDIQDIVANPVKNLFYIINSHSDRVRIYNAGRFRLEEDIIELGNSPGNFVVRPDGKRGYGAMNARKCVTVVNLETNETIKSILLGFPPYAMCFNESGTHLYAASRDSSTVAIIDTDTNEVILYFDLPPRLPGVIETNFAEIIGVSPDEKYIYIMPKRPELLIYDISMVFDPNATSKIPVMVQSEDLATTPFAMFVVRNQL